MGLSESDLNKRAQAFMKDSDVESVYVTSDGNIFKTENKHYADAHAKTQKCEVIEIKKSKAEAKPKAKPSKSKSE